MRDGGCGLLTLLLVERSFVCSFVWHIIHLIFGRSFVCLFGRSFVCLFGRSFVSLFFKIICLFLVAMSSHYLLVCFDGHLLV